MSHLQADSIVAASVHSLSADLGNEAVILDIDAGEYWSLNSVSARVWELIQKPRSVRQIVESLMEEFEVTPERCEYEVKALLVQMREHGLVEVREAESSAG